MSNLSSINERQQPNNMPEGYSFKNNIKKIQKAMVVGIIKGIEDLGDLICEYAMQQVPVQTGNLMRSISANKNMGALIKLSDKDYVTVPVNFAKVHKDGRVTFEVGAYAPYAAAVEFGSKPHVIRPKNKEMLHWKGVNGEKFFAFKVNHPGTDPQPFMRPAIDEVKGKKSMDLIMNAVNNEMIAVAGKAKDDEVGKQ